MLDKKSNKPVTSSIVIADHVCLQHKNVLAMIKQNLADFEEFGLVAFETRPRSRGQHGGGSTEYANLNEQQATLLLTYMRNSVIVKQFKVKLVKAFYELAEAQRNKPPAPLSRLEILQMALEAEQKLIELEAEKTVLEEKVIADTPKVEFIVRIGWVMAGRYIPYQKTIDDGYVQLRLGNYTRNGLVKISSTTMITNYGLLKLQEMMNLIKE
jgi:phage regulator Rha-like protein